MKTISGDDFLKLLYSNHNSANISENETLSKLTIKFKTLLIDFQKINEQSPIFFKNLIFSGNNLEFHNKKDNQEPTFQVDDCVFDTNVNFEGKFKDLSFRSNIFNGYNFEIINSNIGVLDFFNNDDPNDQNAKKNIFTNGSFKIHKCTFDSVFWLKNVQFMKNTRISIHSVDFKEFCSIDFIYADQLNFYNCNFFKEFKYFCEYNKSEFRRCNFFGLTSFGGLLNLTSSFLWFDNCIFEKLSNFNNYWLYKLRLEDTIFLDSVSFQETYFDIISIVRTIFEKKVWFDDIQIKKINQCDRRTIRIIKQELQKAENKIDYNKFRIYEFNAYKEEIKQKLIDFKKDKNHFYHRKREPIQLRRDLFILNISDFVSEYGTDWKRAFYFIKITGFISFLIFYILENWNYNFDFKYYEDFLYGYLRFFLITDFKNEYYESGERVLKFNCFISLFPFIIGKIAVAFGLYEMIQSFRKFKA